MYKKIIITALIVLSFSTPCYAYIDMGTGAYFIQSVIAIVGVVLFYLRHPVEFLKIVYNKILDFFKRDK